LNNQLVENSQRANSITETLPEAPQS